MYLKSLVLKGFKSFADRSALSLEPGITAVVGPNGSGKSNISDAVLWVLGERNAKHLRGQAMEDVIFAGSSARKATGLAEVELVLDNSDGKLPVDFNEVSITRRMYRSGESEYLINGSVARRMDVLDILHDSGLGTGTHSIIGQGSLDSILQSKPEDRRALIEEAAGVLKHKQRKAKSERKLAAMDATARWAASSDRSSARRRRPALTKSSPGSLPTSAWRWQWTTCVACVKAGMRLAPASISWWKTFRPVIRTFPLRKPPPRRCRSRSASKLGMQATCRAAISVRRRQWSASTAPCYCCMRSAAAHRASRPMCA